MASAIDATKPTAGSATTQSVRDNFAAAKSEIEALQDGTGLAAGAVSDAAIGDRTPDQSITAVTGAGTLSQIINWFANIIKAISGETNWFDAPAVTLKSHVANTSNPHGVTAVQIGMAAAAAFTPTIVGVTTAGTGTYATQSGKYVLSPNNDYYIFYIVLTWTAHTGTGNMRIGGMPATALAGSFSSCTIGQFHNIALTAGNVPSAYALGGTTQIALEQFPTGGGASASIPIDTAGTLIVSGIIFI